MPGVFDDPSAPAVPVAAPPPARGAGPFRAVDDIPATRRAVFEDVLAAAAALPPVANARHTLRLTDVEYAGPDAVSKAEHKRAVLRGDTLARRLVGTWRLEAADGTPVATRRATVARVPYLTDAGTYVLNGVDYTLAHQLRLRPGVFTRRRDNGEVEAHVNVLPGRGLSHRVLLDPDTGVLRLGVGQARLPLVPVLRALGATEQEMRAAWGNGLWVANATRDDPTAVDKLYRRLVRRGQHPDREGRAAAVRAALEAMPLDPEVTARTLGRPFAAVSKDQLLATTARVLAVHGGAADPDDRDSIAFQHLVGPEDLFAERMRHAHRVLRPLLMRASWRGSLDPLAGGVLTRHLEGAVTKSGLGQSLEEIGPADVLDQVTRVTRLGEGGIPSADSVPDESRSVQPSHFGYVDLLRTPESFSVGVDSRLATGARKGRDGAVYAPFRDPRTGETHYLTPQAVADKVVAFPGELATGRKHVYALHRGRIVPVRRAKVDLVVPDMDGTFNHLSNLVPLKAMTKGQRVMMGARMTAQALPLRAAEAPLVRTALPGNPDRSFEEEYGVRMGAVVAAAPGVVTAVTPGGVTVRQEDGKTKEYELYDNHPLNRKTYYHNTPAVRPGDRVAAGGLLARSNYTDGGGAAAVGVNLRTAYLPYRGYNFEDAVVVSASAARDKLESEHMYQHDVEWDAKVRRGKRAFVSLFPADFTRAQLDRLDADGVVRPGQTLEPGDPVVLVARERDRALNQVSRGKDASFSSDTLTWDHHAPGLVTDVERTKAGVVVTVKSYSPVKVGDKIAGRFGDKGVVGAVVPDDQMPRDAAGRPFEIVLNPLGVITRTNPSQIVEAALGKVARKTGRPVNVPDFKTDEDMVEYALRELGRHGLSDTEDVTDPVSGAKIPGVMTGDRFYMKLHHMAESKAQGRATGGYTNEDVPAKGGPSGSKRVSLMDLNALLSHGATESVRDAKVVRGQKNLDLWAAFMQGKGMPEPQVPFVWRKFLAQLRAAGVHPVPAGRRLRLTALTDADVTALAGDRRLTTADTVDWKAGLKPLPGGLFDPTLTGGHGGTRWAAIALHEPMPNPVMEEPVRRILGLTRKGLEEVLAGRQELGGATGPAAVAAALGRVDLDRAVAAASAQVRTARGGARDAAVVRLRYLKDCRRLGLHPRDWVLSAAPVLPPAFRPVSVMAKSGLPMAADANYLYKDLFEANENLKHMAGAVDDVGAERLAVYNALKAVVGLGDPVNPKHQETGVKGVLKNVFGTSPKFGVVQRKLLGSTVDLVGRAVISPDPDLDMDEVAIPEGSAWEVYRPFVVRRLARAGVSPLEAARQTRDKTDRARTALLAEMGERPVVITRAPVLHRYGVMAFWPRLTAGNTMQVSPLIVKGFNADFDGDTMNFHVPASDGAVKDAVEKMLPSKNLLAVRNFRVHQVPANEFAGGLFHATSATDAARPEQVFRTLADLKEAFHDGRVNADTRVVVLED